MVEFLYNFHNKYLEWINCKDTLLEEIDKALDFLNESHKDYYKNIDVDLIISRKFLNDFYNAFPGKNKKDGNYVINSYSNLTIRVIYEEKANLSESGRAIFAVDDDFFLNEDYKGFRYVQDLQFKVGILLCAAEKDIDNYGYWKIFLSKAEKDIDRANFKDYLINYNSNMQFKKVENKQENTITLLKIREDKVKSEINQEPKNDKVEKVTTKMSDKRDLTDLFNFDERPKEPFEDDLHKGIDKTNETLDSFSIREHINRETFYLNQFKKFDYDGFHSSYFWHICGIRNLLNIIKYGYIYCRRYAKNYMVTNTMQINQTTDRVMSSNYSYNIERYARLYLNPSNKAVFNKIFNESTQVRIAIDTSILTRYDKQILFSLGSAHYKNPDFFCNENAINRYAFSQTIQDEDLARIYKKYDKNDDDETKQLQQSEILVYKEIPIAFIAHIYFKTEQDYELCVKKAKENFMPQYVLDFLERKHVIRNYL